MTFSMGDFAKARDALDDKRIQYKYITRSNGISGFSMGRRGAITAVLVSIPIMLISTRCLSKSKTLRKRSI